MPLREPSFEAEEDEMQRSVKRRLSLTSLDRHYRATIGLCYGPVCVRHKSVF